MGAPSIPLANPTFARASAGSRVVPFAERLFAAGVLILAGPIIVAAAMLVAILSRCSPFIAHRRVGQYGIEFWMLKLRTMWDSERKKQPWRWVEYISDAAVPVAKGCSDPRVTSCVAQFYRRFSIDELPQLWHVITGRMRLVGPRPITPAEWNAYYGDKARPVLLAEPGITGLWQVIGRNRLSYAQRRRLDLFYVAHRGLRLDALILLRTPVRVLTGRDAG